MLVEILFPDKCTSIVQRREFLQEIYLWGQSNLTDQVNWAYKKLLFEQIKMTNSTESISFFVANEEDALALKLTWV